MTAADIGRPLTHFTHRMKEMPPLPAARAVHAAGKPIDAEVERPDGTWCLRRVQPYRTHEGAFDGIVVTFTDITDRKRTEERVAASERLYRVIGESIDYGVWVCDPDGRNTYVSDSFLKLVGMTQAQWSEFGWGAALHPDDAEKAIAAWQECVRTGGVWDIEHRFKGVDGKYYPVLARGMAVRDAVGKVLFWAGINMDISGLKRAEAALKEADKHKDSFLAMLAHELRNPLGPVRNAVQYLRQLGPTDARLVDARDMIDRQVGHMARLVDDLLDATRIAQGKILIRPERCDLAAVARQTAEDFRSVLEGSGVRLTVEVPPAPVWVDGDCTRLAQIVGNLLHNAHKFTNPGGTVTVRLAEDPERHAMLSVRDTGIGIDPMVLPHVFEVFSQADESLDRERGGLGLGLALVKGLAELPTGTVAASSAGPGRGSEFVVRLPLADGPAPMAAAPAPVVVDGRGYKVLVIEDTADAAEPADAADLVGHTSGRRRAGRVAEAKAFVPDVVLCDIRLPGMSGYDVAQALRQEPALVGATVVALTGYGRDEDQAKARAAGFDVHLTKPIDYEALRRVFAGIGRRA